ncbi:MAG: hypothetical protein ACYC38_10490, partial [Eubacteriales bacterium]
FVSSSFPDSREYLIPQENHSSLVFAGLDDQVLPVKLLIEEAVHEKAHLSAINQILIILSIY